MVMIFKGTLSVSILVLCIKYGDDGDSETQMYEVDWFEPHDQEIEATVTDVAQVFC